jgi:hypothetical protein
MCPNVERTRSNDPSSNGSSSASPLDPLDRELRGLRLRPARFEELWHEIEPGDPSTRTRSGNGRVPGAVRDVDDRHPGLAAGASDDELAHVGDVPRERCVIPRTPGRALPRLELVELDRHREPP